VTYIIVGGSSSLPERVLGWRSRTMSRPRSLTAVLRGEHSPTADIAILPALSIAILFVPSVPITSFTVTVALSFLVTLAVALTSVSIPFRIPLALPVLPVPLSVSMAVSAAFAFAFSLRTLTTMLAALWCIGILPTVVTFETPVVDTIHLGTVPKPFPARPALRARVPCAWSCRRRL